VIKPAFALDTDMSTEDKVTAWINDLAIPSRREAAARNIVNRYMNELLALVRRRLHGRLRGVMDPEDVAQSVWGSFFETTFELNDRNALLALLADMAIKKTCDAARRQTAAKRDIWRERQMESSAADFERADPQAPKRQKRGYRPKTKPGAAVSADSLCDKDTLERMVLGAHPEHAAFVIEFVENLPPDLTQVFFLLAERRSNEGIARELGNCDLETVRRQIRRLRRRIQKQACTESP